jgi:hypothetical protein
MEYLTAIVSVWNGGFKQFDILMQYSAQPLCAQVVPLCVEANRCEVFDCKLVY